MEESREECEIPPVSKSVLEILENYCDVNSNQEATNVDELMPWVRKSLYDYNDPERFLIVKNDDGGRGARPRGRLARSLIKSSTKRKTVDNEHQSDDVQGSDEVLKRIGIPKSRRSYVFSGRKSTGMWEMVTEGGEAMEVDGHVSEPDGDPLKMTPLKVSPRSCTSDEKLMVTPLKARGICLSPGAEDEAIHYSAKSQEDFSIEGVSFFNNFDVFNEILNDKTMSSLLGDDEPPQIHTDFDNYDNSIHDNEDLEPNEQRDREESSYESRRRSSRIKTPTRNEHLELDDSSLEEIMDEPTEEPLSDAVIRKLRNIVVKLEHSVPPQHQIEPGTIRRGITPEERLQFKKYSVLKGGRFSTEENEILKKNWKRFCEVHGLDIPQTHFFKCRYQGKMYIEDPNERRKFVMFLAQGLPSRTLRAVYVRFRIMFGFRKQVKCKRYTEEEDEKIMKYMTCQLPVRKSEVLTKLLGRPYGSIYQRYLQLMRKRKKNSPRTSVSWTLELMEKFLKNLLDVTISEDVRDLKDAMIPNVVWRKLQDIMNIEFTVLKKFWALQLHAQLFFPRPIYFNEIKIMLIEYLYGTGITNGEEIDWRRVNRCFDGLTTQFLSKMCPRLVKNSKSRTWGELIERLYVEKIPILKIVEDSYLPRVRWEAGRLKVIDEFVDGVS
ncbi:transcription termination factor 1-like [Diachasmimorpha longicaudata]|uniref:transcription termination factor 1-like n=1 Tax=Diachasmimorpha longicaudata TaxID=58733 RepID=UPI0030B87C93